MQINQHRFATEFLEIKTQNGQLSLVTAQGIHTVLASHLHNAHASLQTCQIGAIVCQCHISYNCRLTCCLVDVVHGMCSSCFSTPVVFPLKMGGHSYYKNPQRLMSLVWTPLDAHAC